MKLLPNCWNVWMMPFILMKWPSRSRTCSQTVGTLWLDSNRTEWIWTRWFRQGKWTISIVFVHIFILSGLNLKMRGRKQFLRKIFVPCFLISSIYQCTGASLPWIRPALLPPLYLNKLKPHSNPKLSKYLKTGEDNSRSSLTPPSKSSRPSLYGLSLILNTS